MYQINKTAISWLPPEQIEPAAMQQIVKIASMPFIYKHVAIMPDCHVGMGATVGSCIPTDGAIIPAAVGVDIGCGMVAVRTPLSRDGLPADLSGIREGIERRIPLSAGKYNRSVSSDCEGTSSGVGGEGRGAIGTLQEAFRQGGLEAPAGFSRFGQPLHRDNLGRVGGRLGVPALRFAWHRQQDRHAAYPDSAEVDEAGVD